MRKQQFKNFKGYIYTAFHDNVLEIYDERQNLMAIIKTPDAFYLTELLDTPNVLEFLKKLGFTKSVINTNLYTLIKSCLKLENIKQINHGSYIAEAIDYPDGFMDNYYIYKIGGFYIKNES